MESLVRDALAKCLDLDDVRIHLIIANLGLNQKLDILKAAINTKTGKADQDAANFTKAIDQIRQYSSWRNMVAHDLFGPSFDGDAVEFLRVRAKKELVFDNTVWHTADFENAYQTIDSFSMAIRKYMHHLHYTEALVKALMESNPLDRDILN